jgi:BlaI family penicillinase repressor
MLTCEVYSSEATSMGTKERHEPALSHAEWEVMKVLWDEGPLAARDVFARLPRRGWAYKTVKTLLSRLVAKQALSYEQIGNSYLYRAAIDRDRATRQEVRSVFQRLISEACSPVLAQFIEEADLSDAEIRQLKRKLDEKRRGSSASEGGSP